MNRTLLPVLLSAAAVALGPAWASAAEEAPAAARVNGVEIPEARLNASFGALLEQQGVPARALANPEQYKALRRQVLDTLIGQELLWQQADKKGLVVPQEEVDKALKQARDSQPSKEAYLQRLQQAGFTEQEYAEDVKKRLSVAKLVNEDIAPTVSVSDEEVHEFYSANPQSFTRPEQVRVSHILIKVASGASETDKAAAKAKAEDIAKEAKGGGDFAELAKKYSEDASGPKGGDLGFIARGQTVQPFEEAAFALKPGEVSGVIETPFGFHIIKVEEVRAEQVVPEQEVKERVRDYLRSQKLQAAVQERIKELRDKGKVKIVEVM